MTSVAYVRTAPAESLPPPSVSTGAVGWLRANLFSSPGNIALTLFALWLVWVIIPPILNFAFFHAVWVGEDRNACLGPAVGACWPFVEAKFGQFMYGTYPDAERWRPNLVYLLLAAGLIPLAIPRVPHKSANAFYVFVIFPVLAFFLLVGGVPGLPAVETTRWGGLLVTLVVSFVGIEAALPLGILLALGRRSKLPIIKVASVCFIEFWRGVPLITVLFMSSVMLPLFLSSTMQPDKLLRALVGVALFSSAYMAEVVRGGLQAMPRGQTEGAAALGLGYWQSMRLVILPQALKLVIPGIVNTFIGLFKDTSLVMIIGIFDLLGAVQRNFTDPKWASPVTSTTGYLFAAAIFWAFCFAMSRYSAYMEHRLNRGRRH
ncbi:amino acid ABC transporter permease [Segnochrobactrum spirostomi]|uniref:Amino acid ABC transporter permease n=1 Tax=Segnochrobactrum spirostomi TaxID=2608987 RepID=A0A6A7Y173_9HYPH|nr:amino acid ABC transporter permease [Segnochrobactrum spirostomi]MQT12147.1 amino acid ABC transporter permease [Segnochrobactrum spirostomi]